MTRVAIDAAGVLELDGRRVFPIGVSNPPPRDGKAPSGRNGLAELAAAGVNLVRSGRGDWRAAALDEQLAAERALADAAAAHGIAWSGPVPSVGHPDVVPRFPTLHEERFMAYQAIVAGARGLMFFGGHLTQVARPVDANAGWNWTFWELVLRPLVVELTSTAVQPVLLASDARLGLRASAADVELLCRQGGRFLYVVAVRRGGATSRVVISGLPARTRDGTPLRGGQALFEYVQEPPPPPLQPGHQVFRSVAVANGQLRDWFGPHDVHVYRFAA